jgi:hypothetical protein
MIRFRRGTTMANTPLARLPPLFVNSPAGNAYGSTSMDCHYPLRPRVNWVVRVYRDASAAAGTDGVSAVAFGDRK